jgi:hypothetical protein
MEALRFLFKNDIIQTAMVFLFCGAALALLVTGFIWAGFICVVIEMFLVFTFLGVRS